jgi:hypothetical protein
LTQRFSFHDRLRLKMIPDSDFVLTDSRPWVVYCGQRNNRYLPVLVNPNQTRMFRCRNTSAEAERFGGGQVPWVHTADGDRFTLRTMHMFGVHDLTFSAQPFVMPGMAVTLERIETAIVSRK